ncbi:unnamed protein product [Adineta steineri]|uniref:Uncharacterized protein n=1 Tax=Adineta steineri TaxID=433720 RepID=A0A813Y9G6_9BILA|nr:unnamed protein product [Adineta steineri]CAF0880989.1 unnamed protein product [Adineta steineri]CAF0891888.1 unnamed protein product [Adineta steineri]
MKIVLILLILCFCVNLITAFSWFNFGSDEEPKPVTKSVKNYHSTVNSGKTKFYQQNQSRNNVSSKNNTNRSPLQQALMQRQYLNRNITNNTQNGQIIYPYGSRGNIYQQQNRSLNNPMMFHQGNRVMNKTNNRIINPKFHSYIQGGKNNNTIPNNGSRRILLQDSLVKSVTNNSSIPTNKTQIFRARSTGIVSNHTNLSQRRIPARFNQQQRLKSFSSTTSVRSNVKSGLKQQNEQKNIPSRVLNSNASVHNSPLTMRNTTLHH